MGQGMLKNGLSYASTKYKVEGKQLSLDSVGYNNFIVCFKEGVSIVVLSQEHTTEIIVLQTKFFPCYSLTLGRRLLHYFLWSNLFPFMYLASYPG